VPQETVEDVFQLFVPLRGSQDYSDGCFDISQEDVRQRIGVGKTSGSPDKCCMTLLLHVQRLSSRKQHIALYSPSHAYLVGVNSRSLRSMDEETVAPCVLFSALALRFTKPCYPAMLVVLTPAVMTFDSCEHPADLYSMGRQIP